MARNSREGMYGSDQFDKYHGIEVCNDCGNELGSRSCVKSHTHHGEV